jgi:hypothetical protein
VAAAATQIWAVSATDTGCTRYEPSPGTRKNGNRRRIHAMLLTRMSSGPKTSVGRTIACERPESRSAFSVAALPRKYANGELASAFATLMWTTRRIPASRAAPNSAFVFSSAFANVVSPRS